MYLECQYKKFFWIFFIYICTHTYVRTYAYIHLTFVLVESNFFLATTDNFYVRKTKKPYFFYASKNLLAKWPPIQKIICRHRHGVPKVSWTL